MTFPGNQGMFIRRTLDEIMETTHQSFIEECPPELIMDSRSGSSGATYWIRPLNWDGQKSSLSMVQFKSVTHGGKQDPDKFKSLNLGWVAFEELSEIEKPIWLMLQSRLRRNNSRRIAVAATNPPRPKHWITKMWNFDKPTEGHLQGYYLVKSKTSDNIHLPPDYEATLRATWPASWVHRYVDCHVGFLPDGQGVYQDVWNQDVHCPEDGFEPVDAKIVQSHDYGRMPAISWAQFVRDGERVQLRVLAEIQGYNAKYDEFLAQAMTYRGKLFGSNAEYVYCGGADGNSINRQTNKSDVDILESFGVTPVVSTTDKTLDSKYYRAEIVRQWLTIDGNDQPGLIVHPRCNVLTEGFMGGYQYPKDMASGEHYNVPRKDGYYDHLQDTVQYALINFADMGGLVLDPSSKPNKEVVSTTDQMTSAAWAQKQYERNRRRKIFG